MSALSDQLVSFAILAYLVAMISHAVEYALGNSRARVATSPAVHVHSRSRSRVPFGMIGLWNTSRFRRSASGFETSSWST